MKTDLIHVTSSGAGMEEAMNQAEATAVFKKLSKKDAIQLRLLAEEMMGMFRSIAGDVEGDFFIEDHNHDFALHLCAETRMTGEKRKKLLDASTTGQNAAAKGVMGKLRDLFSKALEPEDDYMPMYYMEGWLEPGMGSPVTPMMHAIEVETWSLNQYRDSLEGKEEGSEEWDELEKSIVANIADEVEIAIRGEKVEMIIRKKFND